MITTLRMSLISNNIYMEGITVANKQEDDLSTNCCCPFFKERKVYLNPLSLSLLVIVL